MSAFAPPEGETCRPDYKLEEGVCVHDEFEAPNEPTRKSMLRAYKLGARAPMITREDVVRDPGLLPPDALRGGARVDAAEAKQKRLAALDAMIARARGLAGTPSDGGAAHNGATTPGASAPAASAPAASAPAGDLAQKLSELRDLVQRMPDSDSEKLRGMLERDGFSQDEMRALLPQPLE